MKIIPRHIGYVTLKIAVLKTRTRIDLGLQYAHFLENDDEIFNIFGGMNPQGWDPVFDPKNASI